MPGFLTEPVGFFSAQSLFLPSSSSLFLASAQPLSGVPLQLALSLCALRDEREKQPGQSASVGTSPQSSNESLQFSRAALLDL
jgi:hypothetical protein